MEGKEKSSPAADDKGKQDHEIECLCQCQNRQEPYTHKTIEGIQSVGQQRGPLWKVKIGCEPRRFVHLGNGLIDPPDVPDIGEAVPNVCEKMGVEMKDERKGQEAEANKVKKERDQSFGNKSGPEQIHQSLKKKRKANILFQLRRDHFS